MKHTETHSNTFKLGETHWNTFKYIHIHSNSVKHTETLYQRYLLGALAFWIASLSWTKTSVKIRELQTNFKYLLFTRKLQGCVFWFYFGSTWIWVYLKFYKDRCEDKDKDNDNGKRVQLECTIQGAMAEAETRKAGEPLWRALVSGKFKFISFLSDPSPIIGNACHSLTDWLTHSLRDI